MTLPVRGLTGPLVTRGLGAVVVAVVPTVPNYGNAQGGVSTVDSLTASLGLIAEIEAAFDATTISVDVTETGDLVVVTSPTVAVATVHKLGEAETTVTLLHAATDTSSSPTVTAETELDADVQQSVSPSETTVVSTVDSTIVTEEKT